MTAAFYPLRLVEEHLDGLEGLLVRERALLWDRRDVEPARARVRERMHAHLDALSLRREQAVREAGLRLHGRSPGARAAAAWTLVAIEAPRDFEGGLWALRSSDLAGIGQTGSPEALSIYRRMLVRGSELSATDREEITQRAQSSDSVVARWAFVAAAHHKIAECTDPALRVLSQSRPPDAALVRAALVALNRVVSRGAADPSASFAMEVTLGERMTEVPGVPLIAGLFGHLATGLRLSRAIERGSSRPASELTLALGLVGLPRFLPLLHELAASKDLPTQHAARRAIHTVSGETTGLREDGTLDDAPHVQKVAVPKTTSTALMVDNGLSTLDGANQRSAPCAIGWRALWGSSHRLPLDLITDGTTQFGPWGALP